MDWKRASQQKNTLASSDLSAFTGVLLAYAAGGPEYSALLSRDPCQHARAKTRVIAEDTLIAFNLLVEWQKGTAEPDRWRDTHIETRAALQTTRS